MNISIENIMHDEASQLSNIKIEYSKNPENSSIVKTGLTKPTSNQRLQSSTRQKNSAKVSTEENTKTIGTSNKKLSASSHKNEGIEVREYINQVEWERFLKECIKNMKFLFTLIKRVWESGPTIKEISQKIKTNILDYLTFEKFELIGAFLYDVHTFDIKSKEFINYRALLFALFYDFSKPNALDKYNSITKVANQEKMIKDFLNQAKKSGTDALSKIAMQMTKNSGVMNPSVIANDRTPSSRLPRDKTELFINQLEQNQADFYAQRKEIDNGEIFFNKQLGLFLPKMITVFQKNLVNVRYHGSKAFKETSVFQTDKVFAIDYSDNIYKGKPLVFKRQEEVFIKKKSFIKALENTESKKEKRVEKLIKVCEQDSKMDLDIVSGGLKEYNSFLCKIQDNIKEKTEDNYFT